MAFVTGFKGTHFTSGLVLDDLIIPPYDTLDSEAADHYRKKSPYNFSHVDLASKEEEDYSHSLRLLELWSKKGVTQETPAPCYFLYRQNFNALGKKHQRDTLLCTVGLADFSKGAILPHENTFGKYKADRLQLLRKTQHNLSHIFGMVKDSEGFLATQFESWSFETPYLQAKGEDGVLHSIWKMDVAKAPDISSFFKDKPIYIVDGHHRYESALMYARELGVEGKFENPASLTTFCIANTFDPGLIIYPTHRLLKKGSLRNFSLAKLENDYQLNSIDRAALERFTQTYQEEPRFALLYQEKCWILSPKNWANETKKLGQSVARLGVTWSDHHFLKHFCGVTDENRRELISYDKDFSSSWSQQNNVDLIVFHAPPAVTDVTAVADEKKYMPQKSTFFIPKLAGGLIFRKL